MRTPRSEILCSDNVSVPWRVCRARCTSLTSAELRALTSPDATDRALAHAPLTTIQLRLLYAELGPLTRALSLRRLGRRIRRFGLEELCRGLPERRLTVLFQQSTSRAALVAALALEEPSR